MTDLNFNVSADDAELIDRIVVRGSRLDNNRTVRGLTRLHCVMDITAVHANGTPLRLADFLAADDFNFAHDWFGIRRNLDRATGALINCFLPRFAEARGSTQKAA